MIDRKSPCLRWIRTQLTHLHAKPPTKAYRFVFCLPRKETYPVLLSDCCINPCFSRGEKEAAPTCCGARALVITLLRRPIQKKTYCCIVHVGLASLCSPDVFHCGL